MHIVTKSDIKSCLNRVGVKPGQTLFIYSDLRTIGLVSEAKNRDSLCRVYLDSLLETLGEEGTVVFPCYTTQVARFDLDFVWEETPTLVGILAEHARRHPKSLRSLHPLNSVAAIGKHAEFICTNNGLSDFGWDSPFHRLYQVGAKLLTIGLPSGYVVGVHHHLEAACGLPYVYNKLLKWKPIVGGKPLPEHFFACVRYLDLGSEYDLMPFLRLARRNGLINSTKLGGSWLHLAGYREIFDAGAKLLSRNPFFMLKRRPGFKYGTIPFDGPTAGRDTVARADDRQAVAQLNWDGYYIGEEILGGDESDLKS